MKKKNILTYLSGISIGIFLGGQMSILIDSTTMGYISICAIIIFMVLIPLEYRLKGD